MSEYTYGRARVHSELRDMGLCVNHKRIERLMKLAHLQGVSRRRGYVVTTCRHGLGQRSPNTFERSLQSHQADIDIIETADLVREAQTVR
jgi:putative transposase